MAQYLGQIPLSPGSPGAEIQNIKYGIIRYLGIL